jgi:hypothetical protein
MILYLRIDSARPRFKFGPTSVPARMGNDQDQHEQRKPDARQRHDQQDAIRYPPMAFRIEHQTADQDRRDARQHRQPQRHVERRDRTVGQSDHEEIQRDKRDNRIDRNQYSKKDHSGRIAHMDGMSESRR